MKKISVYLVLFHLAAVFSHNILPPCLSFIADEHLNKEAFESLLAKLVSVTKSDTISSLEKTYFSVSNLIHRHRKNTDKMTLMEVSGFHR